ncbi:unnamed protein product, partial [Chrysoparadoxa australica]
GAGGRGQSKGGQRACAAVCPSRPGQRGQCRQCSGYRGEVGRLSLHEPYWEGTGHHIRRPTSTGGCQACPARGKTWRQPRSRVQEGSEAADVPAKRAQPKRLRPSTSALRGRGTRERWQPTWR